MKLIRPQIQPHSPALWVRRRGVITGQRKRHVRSHVTSCSIGGVSKALLLRQHHPATESGELTIRTREVGLDPRRLRRPDAPERPAASAR